MRLIPEYEPVERLVLSFVHDFFNTRFCYGKTQCAIIQAACQFCRVEVRVHPMDWFQWRQETRRHSLPQKTHILKLDSPRRAILLEYVPIFTRADDGCVHGMIFPNPRLENPASLERFAQRMLRRMHVPAFPLGYDFASAGISVNDDLVLLAECWFRGKDRQAKLERFCQLFPSQQFHIVPTLAGDVSNDLDMFLWPIRPKVWIASEYPAGSEQARSMQPSLDVLRTSGHTVHRVPGLEAIIRGDINTMPNYVNGVILNQAVLVPCYGRKEDGIIQGILKEYGYHVQPIDCSQIILSNSGVHCISKAVPRLA